MEKRSNTVREIETIKHLIQELLNGIITPSNFRLLISKYQKPKVKALFRDSFPHFVPNHRQIFTDIFSRYFFNEEISKNYPLWKYIDYKDFFKGIKIFHDNFYDRSMKIKEIECFFKERFHLDLNLSHLEKEILFRLNNSIKENKPIAYQTLAEDLNVTKKRITRIIQGLKDKGIWLGSIIKWDKIGFSEYFLFNPSHYNKDSLIFEEKYELFPKLSLRYIIKTVADERITGYKVLNKKIFTNLNILFNKTKLSEIVNYTGYGKKLVTNEFYQGISNFNQLEQPLKKIKDYGIQLLLNSRQDYKHPKFVQIANDYNVSVRTLIRIKAKLLKEQILKPHLFVNSKEFLHLIIISKNELTTLYKMVPTIESYYLTDEDNNRLWISILSIWREDFEIFYIKFGKKLEIYLVTKKYYNSLTGKKQELESPPIKEFLQRDFNM
ncbi:MAG: hypothetical protein ACTSQE_02115 [Candidatus Heimdallarchaeaceae archaeon]